MFANGIYCKRSPWGTIESFMFSNSMLFASSNFTMILNLKKCKEIVNNSQENSSRPLSMLCYSLYIKTFVSY